MLERIYEGLNEKWKVVMIHHDCDDDPMHHDCDDYQMHHDCDDDQIDYIPLKEWI